MFRYTALADASDKAFTHPGFLCFTSHLLSFRSMFCSISAAKSWSLS